MRELRRWSDLYSSFSVQGAEVISEALLTVAGRRHAKRGAGGGEEGGREVDGGSHNSVATVDCRQPHQGVWVGVANQDHVTEVKGRSHQLTESINFLQYILYQFKKCFGTQ